MKRILLVLALLPFWGFAQNEKMFDLEKIRFGITGYEFTDWTKNNKFLVTDDHISFNTGVAAETSDEDSLDARYKIQKSIIANRQGEYINKGMGQTYFYCFYDGKVERIVIRYIDYYKNWQQLLASDFDLSETKELGDSKNKKGQTINKTLYTYSNKKSKYILRLLLIKTDDGFEKKENYKIELSAF